MIPLMVLVVTFAILRLTGALCSSLFDSWHAALRGAPDLVRMVPPRFPRPELLVTVTGVLEILGAIGLLIPATAKLAALCLALLLTALFPANIHAAAAAPDYRRPASARRRLTNAAPASASEPRSATGS